MCIDFDGHHSGGSFFVYVNDFCYYRNFLYTHRYKFSSDKKKTGKESQYIVSRPELGSDPPFGLDRESGVTCHFRKNAQLRTSWTTRNHEQRFWNCS